MPMCSYMVSRLHGCVSALCQGIPILGTSWNFKYKRLFAEDALGARFGKLMSETVGEDSVPNKKFKKQSEEMWLKVLITING